MKRWIRHLDTCDSLESAEFGGSAWFTVELSHESSFESTHYVPFLLGPRQVRECLEQPSWGQRRRNLVLPSRRRFLAKAFTEFYRDAQFFGAHYRIPCGDLIARLELDHTGGHTNRRVEIRTPNLRRFLSGTKRHLLMGIETFRYSERTLCELELHTSDRKRVGSSFCYVVFARPMAGVASGDREMFSTTTGLLGKKLVSFS